MKIFLFLKRTGALHSTWEASFRSIQVEMFKSGDNTIKTLPFYIFQMFLFKIGYLSDMAGDTTVDTWAVAVRADAQEIFGDTITGVSRNAFIINI